ncbi:MAG: hypothetical protein CXR30_16005 [Geobacter sp.]|nr:MAG: hypothetical protein CXR30_16005 [Geobacter sp.]
MLSGTGTFSGPTSNTQFNCVVELVVQSLPVFATSVMKEGITNENGLNSQLALFISKKAMQNNLPFIVLHQSMEDLTRGDSPAPDIGIHLFVDDEAEPPPRITVFEGKRLTTQLEAKRRHEYVVGHVKNGKYIKGGVERFKHSIHGGRLSYAGMIGYIQDELPDFWWTQINSWISELTSQVAAPRWSHEECLSPLDTSVRVSKSTSIVIRAAEKLHLTHLWINLIA